MLNLQDDRNKNNSSSPPEQPVCVSCGENTRDCECAFGPQED